MRQVGCYKPTHSLTLQLSVSVAYRAARWGSRSGSKTTADGLPSLCCPLMTHGWVIQVSDFLKMGLQWPQTTQLHGFTIKSSLSHSFNGMLGPSDKSYRSAPKVDADKVQNDYCWSFTTESDKSQTTLSLCLRVDVEVEVLWTYR